MAATPSPDDILRAWQRIEFFQPYTLESQDKSLRVSQAKLQQRGDNVLPWLSADMREEYEIPEKAAYILHFGLFEKSIANRISQDLFGPDKGMEGEEREQRLDKEGSTCFAKVMLNAEGAPSLDQLSVSSLPWALGHLRKERFDRLYSSVFSSDCDNLANTLNEFNSTLKPCRENGPRILRAKDILALLNTHLTEWADFSPDWQYALQIDWFDNSNANNEEMSEEDEESDSKKSWALPILNSFFFEDLERVIAVLQQGEQCKTLRAYLSCNSKRETDLYSQEGLQPIIDKLHPAKTPLGRWPSEPEHSMSLMQQFAINTAVEELADGGVLSVNGPPGTGKTTLLRDLVAHNIVERARVLSGFVNVDKTLDESGFIVPALTGYEMVIASSNNAAVENISKELPQKRSLAEEFRDLDYLAPTANQIAATLRPKREHKRDKNGEGKVRDYHLFRPLEKHKQCWGMISAALGSKKNRERFSNRLLIDEHFLRKTPSENIRSEDENFLSLWRWKACHRTPSFADAKRDFVNCLKKTEKLQQQLTELAQLSAKLSEDPFINLRSTLTQAEKLYEEQVARLKQIDAERNVLEKHVQHAVQHQKMIENNAPGLFTRLFSRKQVHAHQQALRNAQQNLLTLTGQQAHYAQCSLEEHRLLNQLEAKKHHVQQEIKEIAQQRAEEEQALQRLKQCFPDMTLPDRNQAIDDADLQCTALWQNARINRQRSALFAAAIELHKAWLYEALASDAFRKVILKMGSFLAKPHTETMPTRWWQTLFLIVPVVSTTFASVGRMFNGVKSEELGWLLIDEAGQASPQQAAGAIWRAKRVLIVGDPLQIEPVFTTSPPLIQRLCEDILYQRAEEWNPGLMSVQQIADRANRWGCELEVMNRKVWIGIPLWVHRRCIEPMFSLSNNMAYNGRMIHGLGADKIGSQAVNAAIKNQWIHAAGGKGNKQYRDSHGESLITLLDKLLAENVALRSIYIITPFKAVKAGLLERLEQRNFKVWQQSLPSMKQKEFKEWLKNGIGTVHTFQGKENDIVILVLGCDEDNDGGAQWAASKPNLLNVALTRARNHVFVIGNKKVWDGLPWFRDVVQILD